MFCIPLIWRLWMQQKLQAYHCILPSPRRALSTGQNEIGTLIYLTLLICNHSKVQHWDDCTIAVRDHVNVCLRLVTGWKEVDLAREHVLQAGKVYSGRIIRLLSKFHLDDVCRRCHYLVSLWVKGLIPSLQMMEFLQDLGHWLLLLFLHFLIYK